jgi:hypothetical protein
MPSVDLEKRKSIRGSERILNGHFENIWFH